jgi:transcriptional regulator with XRE-family HTH domain
MNQIELAAGASVSKNVIVDFEKGRSNPTRNNLAAIQRVLEEAGVEFTNGDAACGCGKRSGSVCPGYLSPRRYCMHTSANSLGEPDTALILRSGLLAASRRIGHKRPGTSFETPRKCAAPQDEGLMCGPYAPREP